MRAIDLNGRKFNRLLVIGKGPRKNGFIYWFCRCDCGNERTLRTSALTSGNTKSCGCWNTEVIKQVDHGMTHSPEWNSWIAMKSRCLNPDILDYHNYGGRGISICQRWLDSFQNFYADMGPSEGLTIERIDVNGNYEPSNCTWIPRGEQSRNKRTTRRITAFGEEKLFVDWARDLDLDPSLLHYHLEQGKTMEQIIEERKPIEKLCSCGKTYSTIKPSQLFCTDDCKEDQRRARRLKEKRERDANMFMVVIGDGIKKRYVRGNKPPLGGFKWIKSKMWAAFFPKEDAEIVAQQMGNGATIEQRGIFIREDAYRNMPLRSEGIGKMVARWRPEETSDATS